MDTDHIIQSYIDVCNQALRRNKDRFPFKQILGAAQQAENNKNIEVKIEGASAANSYVFTIKKDQITARLHGECAECQCDRKWRVSMDYLEKVAQNPTKYIQNPASMNWDWMYDVMQ